MDARVSSGGTGSIRAGRKKGKAFARLVGRSSRRLSRRDLISSETAKSGQEAPGPLHFFFIPSVRFCFVGWDGMHGSMELGWVGLGGQVKRRGGLDTISHSQRSKSPGGGGRAPRQSKILRGKEGPTTRQSKKEERRRQLACFAFDSFFFFLNQSKANHFILQTEGVRLIRSQSRATSGGGLRPIHRIQPPTPDLLTLTHTKHQTFSSL